MKPTDILVDEPRLCVQDVRCSVVVIKKKTSSDPVKVRPIFVIPDLVYEVYNTDTDVQYQISSAFLDLLEEIVGEDLVDRHMLDIKFMPADTSQFWRDPRPTGRQSTSAPPTQPATPPDAQPLEKLRELFESAAGKE